ncbi:hypothetical protein PSYPI_38282, partial [Pseudomonas syringae pv. pisi str. 1704B]
SWFNQAAQGVRDDAGVGIDRATFVKGEKAMVTEIQSRPRLGAREYKVGSTEPPNGATILGG